jgi:hypothetical protein
LLIYSGIIFTARPVPTFGDRKPGSDGKLPPVGDTVDVANANWTNSIGATELITVWEDPEFDPAQKAFYSARVMEITTPRWTAYDAFRYGIKMPDSVPMRTQERAYTSPIWYTPASQGDYHHETSCAASSGAAFALRGFRWFDFSALRGSGQAAPRADRCNRDPARAYRTIEVEISVGLAAPADR